MSREISAEFPFESKFIEIKGSSIHYIDEGEGDPILFLHGNPTSSYLWRNIIPYLAGKGRCIAPDLIGMGKSDKPDINYGFFDAYDYVKAFIEKLELKNITLVIHDWGSGIGFHYANLHRDNVRAIAFMEAIFNTLDWEDMPKDFKLAFRLMRTPGLGWFLISVGNMFINKMLPNAIVRKLTPEEKEAYASPYKTISSRKPLRRFPQDVPISGKPADVVAAVSDYRDWLMRSEIPKICLIATPGGIIQKGGAEWISKNFKNVKMVDIGKGIHFVQEDNPHQIGEELAAWYEELPL